MAKRKRGNSKARRTSQPQTNQSQADQSQAGTGKPPAYWQKANGKGGKNQPEQGFRSQPRSVGKHYQKLG